MFSIIIPTWNNLAFVKLCVSSIEKNSTYKHQIIVHINDGSDGTLQWAKNNNILYTYTPQNVGVCVAVNMAAGLATQDYIVYMNDDMYVCPNWDDALIQEIQNIGTDNFMLSATMIEPRDTGNKCVLVQNYGIDVHSFEEERLLKEYHLLTINDWSGATWPPTIVHKKYWHITGGYSIELSPGMSSDDDFSMKMWQAGCRIFKGVAKSRVYHFQTKTTTRIKKNNGRKQFLMKWGINQSTFNKYYLNRGATYNGTLKEPEARKLNWEKWRAKFKILAYSFKK